MAIEASDRPALDPVALRRDFPILDQEINGHLLTYLDSASTSQKPRVVIDAVADYYREYNANVHRGIYTIGEKATAAYERARATVAQFINAPDSHEIVFTRNATEAISVLRQSRMKRSTVSATRMAPRIKWCCTSSIVRLMMSAWQAFGAHQQIRQRS